MIKKIPAAELSAFAQQLNQEVLQQSNNEDSTSFQIDYFTQHFIDHLQDAAEFEDDPIVFSFKKPGIECNAYGVSANNDRLDLIVAHYVPSNDIESITKSEIQGTIKKASAFFDKACQGYHAQLEPVSPAFDAAQTICQLKSEDSLSTVRIFFVTNAIIHQEVRFPSEMKDGIDFSYHIWDIERLYRCITSGQKREIIELDLTEAPLTPIPCIKQSTPEYETYLGVMPGELLANLYEKCGPRLLERNVRSFLQARGKINTGIKECILTTPHMFLAYNNGISATAESLEVKRSKDGTPEIISLRDFQVVNGGQTTASIFTARTKQGADLTDVNVQFKLTVLKNHEMMDSVVPKISEYANSQNKIQTADFSANDPYHRKLEELSRTVWAPARDGSPELTHWYYERARGQFMDDLNRAGTPGRKNSFLRTNPKEQMFTKTDLAKFINSWEQYPHKVSAGAQANFREFVIRLKEKNISNPDQDYFERLVAKAILFRKTEHILNENKVGAYRANIVTYSIAWLARLTCQRINLKDIWARQGLSAALDSTLEEITDIVRKSITASAGELNVTQWCKKEACWEELCKNTYAIPGDLEKELLQVGPGAGPKTTITDSEDIQAVLKISADKWKKLSSWAKQTNNLAPWQRGIAYSIGERIAQKRTPTEKQAKQGSEILKEATRLGFQAE